MTGLDLVEARRAELRSLCRKYGVKRLRLFGSAVRGGFDPRASDLDFLVEFRSYDTPTIADQWFGLQEDLESLLRCRVDLTSLRAAKNPYFLEAANRDKVGPSPRSSSETAPRIRARASDEKPNRSAIDMNSSTPIFGRFRPCILGNAFGPPSIARQPSARASRRSSFIFHPSFCILCLGLSPGATPCVPFYSAVMGRF